jgi:archaeal type IV pilus assembly protein PilA
MMKKIWKNRSGVSPVIATILMVAITVVLAAVLYVMVMGFGTGPSSNPTVSLTKESTSTAHQEKVLVASISEAQAYANMKVSFVIGANVYTGQVASGSLTLTPTGGPTVSFVDVAGDGKVSSGDYFLVTASAGAQAITMSMLYGSDSASIGSISWTST